MSHMIRNPRPGRKFPSPIERSGWWTVPRGCVQVCLADATGYPIDHVVDPALARAQSARGRRGRR
jgi:hypothetical protein